MSLTDEERTIVVGLEVESCCALDVVRLDTLNHAVGHLLTFLVRQGDDGT